MSRIKRRKKQDILREDRKINKLSEIIYDLMYLYKI